MLTKQTKFALAIALQVLIIFVIIIFKLAILSGGTSILLRIEPVDPRDILRGDYVTFQYSDFSNLSVYLFNEKQIKKGDTIYVVLRKTGKYWTARNVQKTKPVNNEIVLKGRVASEVNLLNKPANLMNRQNLNSKVKIVYGIEEYFIPEGEGRNFSFSGKDAVARVILDENGNAVLQQIFVDDKPWP